MLIRCSKSTLQWMLLMQPFQTLTYTFSPERNPSSAIKHFVRVPPSKHKTGLKSSVSFPFCLLPVILYPTRYLLQFPKLYNASRPPIREGRSETAWETTELSTFIWISHNSLLKVLNVSYKHLELRTGFLLRKGEVNARKKLNSWTFRSSGMWHMTCHIAQTRRRHTTQYRSSLHSNLLFGCFYVLYMLYSNLSCMYCR